MKKLMISLLFACTAVIYTDRAAAQVQVGVHINIGDQPDWGPVGYDYVEYYYLPEIECYYYVPSRQYVYLSNGRWTFSAGLPPMYSRYDLYSGYKVPLRDRDAYLFFNDHRVKYAPYGKYRNRQVILRNKHDNGNHYGWYKDKSRGPGGRKGKWKNKD